MATKEQVEEQAKKKLSINRIPPKTKEEFKSFADYEFEGDFGMCLKWCLEQALEYQSVKSIYFSQEGIEKMLDLIHSTSNQDTKDSNSEITRNMAGKPIYAQSKSEEVKK